MCLNPVSVRINTPYRYGYQLVPCGKCIQCLKQYQQNWLVRLFYESKEHSKMCFLTLTYNNDSVPTVVDTNTGEMHYSLCKRHLQLFFKRIRRKSEYHSKPLKFSYFACGEYGPRTLRPHYHLILFGVSSKEILPFLSDWEQNYGYTLVKDIEYNTDSLIKTSTYVSKYCSKGVFENPKVAQEMVEPAFRLASKGLGLSYVEHNKQFHLFRGFQSFDDYLEDTLLKRRVVLPNNRCYSMPRYYKEKIYGTKNLLSHRLYSKMVAMSDDFYLQRVAEVQAQNPSWSFGEAVSFLALQDIKVSQYKGQSDFRRLAEFYDKSKI